MKFNKKNQYFFLQRSYRNSKKIIAGLDLSLRHSAIVILDSEGQMLYQETVDCETKKQTKSRPHDIHELRFKVNGKDSGEVIDVTINEGEIDHIHRIMVIEARIESLLKKFKVDIVAVEGYSFASGSTGRVFQIGELGGLIKCMIRKLKLTSYIIPPTSLKSYIAGNGHAKKPEMQTAILKKYGVAFEDDNEADAFALAHLVLELGEETTLYCIAGGPDAFRRDVETMKDGAKKKKV